MEFLSREPWCRRCFERDLVVLAVDLEHILPVDKRPDLKYEPGNWQPLCVDCHRRKTRLEGRWDQGCSVDGIPYNMEIR